MFATMFQYYGEYRTEQATPTWVVGIVLLVTLGFVLVYVASYWRIFTKAGEPGWYAIVPFLNTATLCRVAGRPEWWFLLMFIPCLGQVFLIIVLMDLAKAFGRGGGFGLGLVFLTPIFIPLLAFGPANHVGIGRKDYRPSSFTPVAFGGGFGAQSATSGWDQGGQVTPGGWGQAPTGLPPIGGFAGTPRVPATGGQTPPPQIAPPSFGSLPPSGSAGSDAGGSTTPGPSISSPVSGPEAGWYADPSGSGWRWWDGTAWTDNHSS